MNKISLKIVPGYECNQCCSYCDARNKDTIDSASFDHFEAADEILSIIKDTPNFYIEVDGGDALWYWDISKWYLSYNLPTYLFTNGTLIDEDKIKFFHQDTILRVSLDGPEKLHNSQRFLRNGKNAFQATIHGINLLRQHHIKYCLAATITYESLKYLEEMKDFFFLQFPDAEKVILTTQMFPDDPLRLKTEDIYNKAKDIVQDWPSLFTFNSFHKKPENNLSKIQNVEVLFKPSRIEVNLTGFRTPTLIKSSYDDLRTIKRKIQELCK